VRQYVLSVVLQMFNFFISILKDHKFLWWMQTRRWCLCVILVQLFHKHWLASRASSSRSGIPNVISGHNDWLKIPTITVVWKVKNKSYKTFILLELIIHCYTGKKCIFDWDLWMSAVAGASDTWLPKW